MNKIVLNRREVLRLCELYDTLNESGDFGLVTLDQDNSSGIGTTLTATFLITHGDIEGNFTVNITDVENW